MGSLNDPPGAVTKGQANRMIYMGFDEHITRKHGVVIEGWPHPEFKCPSAIGSQLELKVLLNSWRTGTTRFRKMSVEEHVNWLEERANSDSVPVALAGPPLTQSPPPPSQHNDPDPAMATSSTPLTSFIHFEPSATPSISTSSTARVSKKPQKTRSDKGKPRKKAAQVTEAVFSMSGS